MEIIHCISVIMKAKKRVVPIDTGAKEVFYEHFTLYDLHFTVSFTLYASRFTAFVTLHDLRLTLYGFYYALRLTLHGPFRRSLFTLHASRSLSRFTVPITPYGFKKKLSFRWLVDVQCVDLTLFLFFFALPKRNVT